MSSAWLLPDETDPEETVCVQIEVPKDDKHIMAFFGALGELGRSYNWQWDGLKSGLAVAKVWERQINLAAQAVRTDDNCMVDCNDIEDCLETSTTIIQINVDIDVNETNITTNETNITVNETNITNNETDIDIILNGGVDINIYPPAPGEGQPDELCGASFYITNALNQLIKDAIEDALTLTLEEFLEGLFGIGGFEGSWVKQWFNFIVAVGNPDLDDECDAAVNEVAEIFYCYQLDKDSVITAIDASTTITEDAQAAYIGAFRSITDAKLNGWAFIGSQDDSNDCSEFCESVGEFEHTFDFTVSDGGWVNMTRISRPYGVWENGVGWKSVYAGAGQGIPDDERLYIEKFGWDDRLITRVTLYFTSTGIQGGSSRNQALRLYDDGGLGQNYNFGGFIVPDTWTEQADPDDNANGIYTVTVGDSSSDNCEIVCTKIVVQGTGSNPFD